MSNSYWFIENFERSCVFRSLKAFM